MAVQHPEMPYVPAPISGSTTGESPTASGATQGSDQQGKGQREDDGMTKVLICATFGGFGLSRKALHRLRELGSEHALAETDVGETWPDSIEVRSEGLGDSFLREIPRDDPLALQVFEELGQDASGRFCKLVVVEVPDDAKWHIEEYDGNEHVAEDHRTWP